MLYFLQVYLIISKHTSDKFGFKNLKHNYDEVTYISK